MALEDKVPCAINGLPDVFIYIVEIKQFYCKREDLKCPYREVVKSDNAFMTPARCLYYDKTGTNISPKVP